LGGTKDMESGSSSTTITVSSQQEKSTAIGPDQTEYTLVYYALYPVPISEKNPDYGLWLYYSKDAKLVSDNLITLMEVSKWTPSGSASAPAVGRGVGGNANQYYMKPNGLGSGEIAVHLDSTTPMKFSFGIKEPPRPSEGGMSSEDFETLYNYARLIWAAYSPKYSQSNPQSISSGFDCSGFLQHCFQEALSVPISRTSRDQYSNTERITETDLKPGDLVFYASGGGAPSTGIDHVALYIGAGRIIHMTSRSGFSGIEETTLRSTAAFSQTSRDNMYFGRV